VEEVMLITDAKAVEKLQCFLIDFGKGRRPRVLSKRQPFPSPLAIVVSCGQSHLISERIDILHAIDNSVKNKAHIRGRRLTWITDGLHELAPENKFMPTMP
jgi:hypothetical protein